jgi:hypothetical protein
MGVAILKSADVANPVAAALIDMGVTIYGFAKGELTPEQAMKQLGQTGTSTVFSIYTGLAGAAVFGPGLLAVGASVGGYLLATSVYQSCMAVFENAELAKEEAARVIALSEEACRQMELQRRAFDAAARDYMEGQRAQFNRCFELIDAGLSSEDDEATLCGLVALADMAGKKLMTYQEFERVMANRDVPLIL